jgi:serine/threonine protein kinase
MTLEEGLLFADRYKFIKLLGRGGFAEVWLAEDSLTGVQVAVKVYAPGTGLDEAGLKMFTQEFSMVFDMNHTNLLRPTHFDSWNRQPYLIMPFCKNGSAFKYITEDNKITEEECWNLLHDVAAGLAYLHEKEPPLIHQDIKPDNILVNDEGHFMITDFGISARVRSTIRNGMAQEQSGGTLAYMGPERFSANPKPIMASDVWSMGAMMYELMSGGNPPFGNHGGVLQKNGADIPIIEENFSQELKDIVYACLAKETWDRPSARKVEEMTYNHLHGIVMPNELIINQAQADKLANAGAIPEQPMQGPQGANPINNSQDGLQPPTPQAEPAIKKSKPLNQGGNKKLLYGGIAAAIVAVIVLIAIFAGGGSPEPETVALPRINYDSLAQERINEAAAIRLEADTIISNHPDDPYDTQYGKVEQIYINALKKIDEALADKDSLSADVATAAQQQQISITNALETVYTGLTEMIKSLKDLEFDTSETEQRVESIKPYVTQTNN